MQEQEMLTTKEATKAFRDAGLSENTFWTRVKDGQIKKHLPEGRKRGALYLKAEVIAAIGDTHKEQKASILRPAPKSSTFSQASPQDMPEMAILLETFYRAKISIEKRSAWMERNSQVSYILRHEGKLIGCATIMPLSEQKIIEILENQAKPATKPQEILLYEPGKHYYIYARATGVLQAANKRQRKHWAARLFVGLIKAIVELGQNGIIIDKIYCQGDTVQGEHALRSLGFTQIDINAPTDRKNFELDIPRSGSKFAMKYKNALNAWKRENEEI